MSERTNHNGDGLATDKAAAVAVGARLRDIRKGLGLSLADVQMKSGGVWKAVVVGSYERGDRAITVGRLVELARWYGVEPVDLLKPPAPAVLDRRRTLVAAREHLHTAAELLAHLANEDAS